MITTALLYNILSVKLFLVAYFKSTENEVSKFFNSMSPLIIIPSFGLEKTFKETEEINKEIDRKINNAHLFFLKLMPPFIIN